MKTARMPGTAPRAAVHAASTSDRNVASSGGRLRRRLARAARGRRSAAIASTAPAAIEEGGLHAEHPAEHEEGDRADAHLEREGPVASER